MEPGTKTSKVIRCEFKKTWAQKRDGNVIGTNYDYNVALENGDSGVYSSLGKENDITGQEISYTIMEDGRFGNKIKLVVERKFSGGGGKPRNERSISSQSAMKCAIELCCADKISKDEIEEWHKKIFDFQNKLGNI